MTKIVQMILGLPAALIGCLPRLVRVQRAKWKYRHIDPEVCCCGEMLTKPNKHLDSICCHGGCRSAKEYAISCYTNIPVIETAKHEET